MITDDHDFKSRNDGIIVIEDNVSHDKLKNEITNLALNGSHHYNKTVLMACQTIHTLNHAICSNVDFFFIFKTTDSERMQIYNKCASMIPTFEIFCRILEECTRDNYSCLVIHNSSKSSNWQDAVYYYKAGSNIIVPNVC